MNKKEVLELKKRIKKDDASFTEIAGCYVDANKTKVSCFQRKFLNLEEEDLFKYLEIAKKTLSGKIDNNLINLDFSLESEGQDTCHQLLMGIRAEGFSNEKLLDALYDHIIDTYDTPDHYLILLYHDVYDVPRKAEDNSALDESEEVYDYLLCAICPVVLSKPALSYHEEEQSIAARIRDWVVGMPESAFLFPAFNDRSTDIHSLLFYTKNAKSMHTEFIENGLGCESKRTSAEKQDLFFSMIGQQLGMEEESTDAHVIDINLALDAFVEESDSEGDEDAQVIDDVALEKVLSDADISDKKIESIVRTYKEAFADSDYPRANELLNAKLLANSELLLENRNLKEQNAELNRALEVQGTMYSLDKIEKMFAEYEKTDKSISFPEWLKL